MRTFRQITAQGKIRITISCGILLGELCCNFTTVSHTPFLLQGRQNLAQTEVSYVSSLYEFASLVESSSSAGVNKAQIVATHDGRVIVPVYDRVSFLGEYFKIPNLKKFHHFAFSKETPGMVSCKESVYSPSQSFILLKNPTVFPQTATLPPTVKSDGLTDERKQYLYREIRPFCKPGTEDIVAPAP